MTFAEFDRLRRWRATATTWTRKTCALFVAAYDDSAATEHDLRAVIGYDAAQFLGAALSSGRDLVKLIPPDCLDEVEAAAKELAAALRSQRLSGKLQYVEGRTAEEAALFRAKAEELTR